MEFFRITGMDQNEARLITEVEAQRIEDVLCTVDSETTEAVEQIDPDSAEIFGGIYKKGEGATVWINAATKEIRLTNCDVTIPIPIEYYVLVSRFAWFANEGAIVAVINDNLVEMMELIEDPWLANPLA